MTRRLPSTSALLALEAAARHQSFAKAAQELSLSEGAISRQIAKLEDFLGVRLFHRVGNRVELSAPGASYATRMRTALADIERHTRQLMSDTQGTSTLEIGVIPTLASRWLIPGSRGFASAIPTSRSTCAKERSPSRLRKAACTRRSTMNIRSGSQ